jgi:hypothetical protein
MNSAQLKNTRNCLNSANSSNAEFTRALNHRDADLSLLVGAHDLGPARVLPDRRPFGRLFRNDSPDMSSSSSYGTELARSDWGMPKE